MTNGEMRRILELREQGLGYKKISAILGISWNTVKSYCKRQESNNRAYSISADDTCRQCGKTLTQQPYRKKKVFCSDKCRMTWWNSHPDEMNMKKLSTFVCKQCGTVFKGYDSKNRKYCSRTCYAKARRKEDINNDRISEEN